MLIPDPIWSVVGWLGSSHNVRFKVCGARVIAGRRRFKATRRAAFLLRDRFLLA
jgi:hypothetical protein